jgi:hypothetical protein
LTKPSSVRASSARVKRSRFRTKRLFKQRTDIC